MHRNKKPKTLTETLEGLLMLQNWQTQLLELAILQAKFAEIPLSDPPPKRPTMASGKDKGEHKGQH